MVRLIAAIDKKCGIAKTEQTPWYIKADLKHFRDLTTGHTILMGHSTYKTIGKPLPNRKNVVATHQFGLTIEGCEVIHDIKDYLQNTKGDKWVIGGEQIFEEAIEFADELYLTQIDADYGCDKFFPSYQDNFELVKQEPWQEEDGKKFRFEVWQRKK